MLPKLPLDDRVYADIVEQSRRAIPKRVPEWTDENAHDPGITFLELFSWLTEMQRYYIGRIPDKNRIKFLDLLGVKREDTASAIAEVQVGGVTSRRILPRGTKLLAEDQMFETVSSLPLVPLELDRIISRSELEVSDVTASNDQQNVSFYPFGLEADAGSRLYVSFDRELGKGEQIELSVKLDGDAFRGGTLDKLERSAITPSAALSWKAYGIDMETGNAGWLPLEVTEDETLHFTLSGKIRLLNQVTMLPITVHPANDRFRYWICCTVETPGYEMPPRIRGLMLHGVNAIQKDTLSEINEFRLLPGEEEVHVGTYLALYGDIEVQVRESSGCWKYWRREDGGAEVQDKREPCEFTGPERYSVVRDKTSAEAVIRFGQAADGNPLPAGAEVRVIASVPRFASVRMIGGSNGLPGQLFEVYELPCTRKDAIKLQVGVPDGSGGLLWEDWTRADDFDHSDSADRHFVYDPATRLIRFGNSERGAIPAACSEPNLCLIACELGGGERGNVKPQLISEWVNEEQRAFGLTVKNPDYAAGGKEAETLSETLLRAQAELKRAFRAVTDEDYELLVKETPGVHVARVKAIPLFKPGLLDYPREKAPGQVSVVVVPNSLSDTPKPSQGFLDTIKRHLDSRRLITTEIHVIPPIYVKVTVHAVIVVEPQFIDEGPAIAAALRALLRPLAADGGKDGEGWPFGRPVYKGDIFNALNGRSGIVYIQDLWLNADGPHVKKSKGGDILLPPQGLAYSGRHEIELISRLHI